MASTLNGANAPPSLVGEICLAPFPFEVFAVKQRFVAVLSASSVVFLGLLAACSSSSSSSGSPGKVTTTVDGSKQGGSLTPAEANQYCKDLNASPLVTPEESKRASCALGAVLTAAFTSPKTDAEAQAACSKAFDDCMAKPASTTSSSADGGAAKDPCADAEKKLVGCTATVAEMNACYEEQATALKSFGPGKCSEIKLAGSSSSSSSSGSSTGSACATAKAKCPSAFGSSSSSSASGNDG